MRNNNKGFSMVEIILVIAIMAILGAAIAIQIIKYVGNSRESTDKSNCKTIQSSVEAVLADIMELDTYDADGKLVRASIWDRMSKRGNEYQFYIRRSDDGKKVIIAGLWKGHPSADEIKKVLSHLENPKVAGMKSYEVTITAVEENKEKSGTEKVYTIKNVEVITSSYNFNDDKSNI